MPDACLIVNPAGQIVSANQQVERLFDYPRSRLLGQPVEVLLPEALRMLPLRQESLAAPHTRTRPQGEHLTARRYDGAEFPVEVSLNPLDTDAGMYVVVVMRDMTAYQRAAEELEQMVQQRTAHLRTLLAFSKDLLGVRGLDVALQRAITHALTVIPAAQLGAIYLHDTASQRLILRAAAGFAALPRVSISARRGIVGHVFASRRAYIVATAQEFAALVEACAANDPQQAMHDLALDDLPTGAALLPLVAQDHAVGVLLLLRLTGEGPFAADARLTIDGLANLTAVASVEEESSRRAAVLTDKLARLEAQQRDLAAQLHTAEASMLQAARLAAVGQLAAAVAHEINNPLYAVRNCLYLMEMELSDEVRNSQYLRIARDELARIATIVTRMRDFYRPDRSELAPCDLNQLLEETITLAELNMRNTGIQLVFSPAPDLPIIVGNGDQLRQVFLNLVLNAIDAMPRGGTLAVRTSAGPTVTVVEVQDTGVGIAEEIRGRLFEPFFTNKPTGTGLGLSISAHIVTQHGGQIEVDSIEGQGSTFRVVLPRAPE